MWNSICFSLFVAGRWWINKFHSTKMPGEVKISHNLDLDPELPNELMDIARKQGENPERVCADIQELRDMIYGKVLHRQFVYGIICTVVNGICLNCFANRTGLLHTTPNWRWIFDPVLAWPILQSGKCLQIGKCIAIMGAICISELMLILLCNSCADTTSSVTTIPICTSTWIHLRWPVWVKMTLFRWRHIAISSAVVWWFTKLAIGVHRKSQSTTYSGPRWFCSRWVRWNRKHKWPAALAFSTWKVYRWITRGTWHRRSPKKWSLSWL